MFVQQSNPQVVPNPLSSHRVKVFCLEQIKSHDIARRKKMASL
jgi:hypothetical protein